MIVTNAVNNCFQNIFDFVNDICPDWDENKLRIMIIIICLIIPMLVVYYFSIMTEWIFSLIIYRHKIKINIMACEKSDDIEKWLDDKYYWTSKYMDYKQHEILPFKNLENEIRFVRKKNATHFKMVWG